MADSISAVRASQLIGLIYDCVLEPASSQRAPSTVKTHLLEVFQETGTARQADLVRLASQLVAPV